MKNFRITYVDDNDDKQDYGVSFPSRKDAETHIVISGMERYYANIKIEKGQDIDD